MRHFLKHYIFPLIIFGTLLTDWILWQRGFTPSDWIEYTYNGTIVLLLALEFLAPRNPDWNYWNKNGIQFREAAVEIGFFFFSGWFAGAVTYSFSWWVADQFRSSLGLTSALSLPIVVQIIIVLIVIDLFRYWIHRWMHESRYLWRFHALHHIPERLGVISSTRTHPVDDFLLYVPEMIVLFSLGFNRAMVAVVYSVIWVISLIKHSNVEIQENRFSRHFQIPRYHLHHHEYHDGSVPTSNFAEVFTFWDKVFGTFKDSEVTPTHRVGVPSLERRSIFREFFGWLYLRNDKL